VPRASILRRNHEDSVLCHATTKRATPRRAATGPGPRRRGRGNRIDTVHQLLSRVTPRLSRRKRKRRQVLRPMTAPPDHTLSRPARPCHRPDRLPEPRRFQSCLENLNLPIFKFGLALYVSMKWLLRAPAASTTSHETPALH
jgi:hypothetical protein